MPSSKGYIRNYRQEYKTSKARGEQGTGTENPGSKRKRLRRKMLKLGMVKAGQDVDHRKPLSKGGANTTKNATATSPSKNRSFKRKPDGSIA